MLFAAIILWLILLAILGFGLYLWARSGDNLWQVFTLRRKERDLEKQAKEKKKGEEDELDARWARELKAEREKAKQEIEDEVKKLNRSTDRILSTSFKVFCTLLLLVWLCLGASIMMEFLGFGWIHSVSTRAFNYWNRFSVRESKQSTPERNDMLRKMGVNMRK